MFENNFKDRYNYRKKANIRNVYMKILVKVS